MCSGSFTWLDLTGCPRTWKVMRNGLKVMKNLIFWKSHEKSWFENIKSWKVMKITIQLIKRCLSIAVQQEIDIEVFWKRRRVVKRWRKEVNLKREVKGMWLFLKESATNLMPSRNASVRMEMSWWFALKAEWPNIWSLVAQLSRKRKRVTEMKSKAMWMR